MSHELEQALENKMIDQLSSMGYERVVIEDELTLNSNFKRQLEKFNNTSLSEKEFSRVLEYLKGGNLFDKSMRLRDRYELRRDDETTSYIRFLNTDEWCKNLFQVTNQVTIKGKYENRYDVTLLINGLPLVQIELKRRGMALSEAYNQIKRYKQHSYKFSVLYSYIQIFVISNGVNTKYFSNNSLLDDYKQTFYWTNNVNQRVSNLEDFTMMFLEKCHISKMIARYIVLHQSDQKLMVLRPYQYYAVEAFIERANDTNLNGYVWHTTGSGKTLTSFKLADILSKTEKVDKVIFLVDRKDLDYQTMKEFNNFSNGSVDTTNNTRQLVDNLKNSTNKLVITTIQKLSNAIKKEHFSSLIGDYRDKKVIFIIDECHRSQFGDMHKDMIKFFTNAQYFGFTGTPIFTVNHNKFKTTKDLFTKCLHKYLIKDAIADNNVLGFSVEYVGSYKDNAIQDEEVEGIDKKEFLHSEKRLTEIVDYILNVHKTKTSNKKFNSIFAVDSIQTLIKYYKLFKEKNEELKVATIFTYNPNETMVNDKHSRDSLEEFIRDYNGMFSTNYSTDTFSEYYADVAKRVKKKHIDIVLVVNMFLTGFDARDLNTLYVDKNLEYHNLVQAFSRTNRINGNTKPHGNIVCFRPLKKQTDEAIRLYSDDDPGEDVLLKTYEEYVNQINKLIRTMRVNTPTVSSVDDLQSEKDKYEFVLIFRNINRDLVRLRSFTDFKFSDLEISEQELEDYRSKYRDINDDNKKPKEKASILDDLDFEVELMHKDYINVDYILNLLANLDLTSPTYNEDVDKILRDIEQSQLRSKKELIKEFIEEQLSQIDNQSSVVEHFNDYLDKKKNIEIEEYAQLNNIELNLIKEVVTEYEFNKRINTDMISDMFSDLGFLQRRTAKTKTETFIRDISERYTY